MRLTALFFLLNLALAQSQTSLCRLDLGGSKVELHCYEQSRARGLCFIALHDNENTCVEEVLPLLRQHQIGTFIELRAQGRRLIDFQHQGRKYALDPNRIFSPDSNAVIANAFYFSPQIVRRRQAELLGVWRSEIRPFARNLAENLKEAKLVVSLHNNFHRSDEGSYNLTWYLNGGQEASQAQAIYINPRQANSDFFVVTERFFFEAFQERGFNVVLQNPQALDDGSLSVYCARRGIPYINIEAKHGHNLQQRQMLQALLEVLAYYRYRLD